MQDLDFSCEHESSFRIIGLTESEVNNAEIVLGDIAYRVGKYFKDKNLRVITVSLNENVTSCLLKSLVACADSYVSYDFFISTCNSNDSFIIDVPEHICKLIHAVGGGISFSYTYAGDEIE